MSSTGTNTRDRIVTASGELFRRQGYTGTGMKQIVASAQAPFGSVYHFFPGGKEQLGAEVIRWSGRNYAILVSAYFHPEGDVVAETREAFAGAARDLAASDYADACPIATIALEVSSTSEPLREACAEVFEGWVAGLAAVFVAAGMADRVALDTATAWLSLLEGAFILCRATRSTAFLDACGAAAAELVEQALAGPGPSRS
jgi:AcrR family transcriptional regulator